MSMSSPIFSPSSVIRQVKSPNMVYFASHYPSPLASMVSSRGPTRLEGLPAPVSVSPLQT